LSDIDFQNGFITGMATRGLTKSITFADSMTLRGYLIANGSRGVWPLKLKDGAWCAVPAPTSAIYALNSGPYNRMVASLSADAMAILSPFFGGGALDGASMTRMLDADAMVRSYDTDVFDTPVPNPLEISTANELIVALGGREFSKYNSGIAIAGYFRHNAGYTGPILVSTVAENSFYIAGGGVKTDVTQFTYNSTTYYRSSTEWFMGGALTDTSGMNRWLVSSGAWITPADAAIALIDEYFA